MRTGGREAGYGAGREEEEVGEEEKGRKEEVEGYHGRIDNEDATSCGEIMVFISHQRVTSNALLFEGGVTRVW